MARHHAYHPFACFRRGGEYGKPRIPFSPHTIAQALLTALPCNLEHLHVKLGKRHCMLLPPPIFHQRIAVELVPGRKHQASHAARMLERVTRGNGGGHGHPEENGAIDLEILEQQGEVENLIAQGISVGCQLAAAVAAPVVGNAPVVRREVSDLGLEHLDPMVLTVDEHHVRSIPRDLIIEVAVVDMRNGHVKLSLNS